jgi:hypothetical protein
VGVWKSCCLQPDPVPVDDSSVTLGVLADREWRRPYPLSWFHALVGTFVALGLLFFGFLLASGISQAGTKPGAAATQLVIGVVFFGIWISFSWRLLTIGIYVGKTGMRYRSPFRTTAVTIWIDLQDGESIQTWVNNKGADFLGRRAAFDSAFGEIEQSVQEHLAK